MSARTGIFLLMFFFLSCGKEQMSREALNVYVLDASHGLKKTIQKGSITIEVVYRPKDLIIAQEVGLNDAGLWTETAKRLDSLDYFILRLSENGKEIESNYAADPSRFTQVTGYLSGAISQDIHLRVEDTTIPVETVAFIPAFGTSTATSMLMVFKSDLLRKDGTASVIFDDKMLGTGYNQFDFDMNHIKDVPLLKRSR